MIIVLYFPSVASTIYHNFRSTNFSFYWKKSHCSSAKWTCSSAITFYIQSCRLLYYFFDATKYRLHGKGIGELYGHKLHVHEWTHYLALALCFYFHTLLCCGGMMTHLIHLIRSPSKQNVLCFLSKWNVLNEEGERHSW